MSLHLLDGFLAPPRMVGPIDALVMDSILTPRIREPHDDNTRHAAARCTGDATDERRFPPDRASRRDRDHRGPDLAAPARGPECPRGGPPRPVHQQPQADRPGDP